MHYTRSVLEIKKQRIDIIDKIIWFDQLNHLQQSPT